MREWVIKRARSRLALVVTAIRDDLNPKASLKVWCTVVRPVLEYAIEIWRGRKQRVFNWKWAE